MEDLPEGEEDDQVGKNDRTKTTLFFPTKLIRLFYHLHVYHSLSYHLKSVDQSFFKHVKIIILE